jgi:hypothetical protein
VKEMHAYILLDRAGLKMGLNNFQPKVRLGVAKQGTRRSRGEVGGVDSVLSHVDFRWQEYEKYLLQRRFYIIILTRDAIWLTS